MIGLLRRLGSLRLALYLLLTLGVLAALGSVVPQGLDASEYRRLFPRASGLLLASGADHYYTGVLFRAALALLAINLAVCGIGRSSAGFSDALARGKPSHRFALGEREKMLRALTALGFRVRSVAPLRASRHPWAFLGFPLVHLAPLVVLGGGLAGSTAGFVGTQNVHVGTELTTFYEWSSKAPRRLPFRLAVDDFRLLHYPAELRLQVLDANGRSQLLEGREGRRITVPGSPFAIEFSAFNPTSGDLTYFVEGPAGRAGPFSRGREEGAPIRVRPKEYRDLEVRRAEALVSVRDDSGRVLESTTIAINQPLARRGIRVFLTAWGEDDYKNPYVGLQITRDPGQAFVWSGAVALSLGVLVLLFGRAAWAREEDGVLLLKGIAPRRLEEVLTRGGES